MEIKIIKFQSKDMVLVSISNTTDYLHSKVCETTEQAQTYVDGFRAALRIKGEEVVRVFYESR